MGFYSLRKSISAIRASGGPEYGTFNSGRLVFGNRESMSILYFVTCIAISGHIHLHSGDYNNVLSAVCHNKVGYFLVFFCLFVLLTEK